MVSVKTDSACGQFVISGEAGTSVSCQLFVVRRWEPCLELLLKAVGTCKSRIFGEVPFRPPEHKFPRTEAAFACEAHTPKLSLFTSFILNGSLKRNWSELIRGSGS